MAMVLKRDEVVIYHNPKCGTSRKTLDLLRAEGVEPTVIEYLKTPPSRETVVEIARLARVPLVGLLREKGTPYAELDLGRDGISDGEILARLMALNARRSGGEGT